MLKSSASPEVACSKCVLGGDTQIKEPLASRISDRVSQPLVSYLVRGEVGTWVQNW